MTAGRIEIGTFPMVRDAVGSRDADPAETPDFWEVIVSRVDHGTGIVEIFEENEYLTTAGAIDVLATMEAKYLLDHEDDGAIPAATQAIPVETNLIKGTGK